MASFAVKSALAMLVLPMCVVAPPPPVVCNPNIQKYDVHEEYVLDGPTTLSSITCTPGTDGCTLTLAEAYSISVAVSVGISLGVNTDSVSAGLNAGISWTTGTITTNSGSANCDGGDDHAVNWTCGLAITPSVYEVRGQTYWTHPERECWDDKTDGDFVVQYPMEDAQSKPIVRVWTCACPDRVGWGDPGAPPKCPLNCNGNN